MDLIVILLSAILILIVIGALTKKSGTKSPKSHEKDDIFAEMEKNKQLFLQQIKNSPTVEIKGVVGARGVAGGGMNDEFNISFPLYGWVAENKKLEKSEIYVEMPVPEEEFDKYSERVKPYSVVLIRGKIGKYPNGDPKILMSEFITEVFDDKELNNFSNELQKPVQIVDSKLGKLTLDRTINVFTGKSKWCNREITYYLFCDENGKIDNLLEKAHTLIESAES